MRCGGLVLAAHGSDEDPGVNQRIVALARAIAARNLFGEVLAAFHQGRPAFAEVLDQMTATEITVVPAMMSEGYYSEVVLPRELARNTRHGNVTLRQTRPIGCYSGIPGLVIDRAMNLCSANGMASSDSCLVLVGHGTQRHKQSRVATQRAAEAIAIQDAFGQVQACFLDDQPTVEVSCARAIFPRVAVIPLMIGGGLHALRDIPRRVGLKCAEHAAPPFVGWVGDRKVVCGAAIGSDPRIEDMIVELACGDGVGLPS